MTLFLTGVSNAETRAVARTAPIGLLVQPATDQYRTHVPDYPAWAIDNGCFSPETYIGDEAYLAWLGTLPGGALFATAPDVVGDPVATLRRSLPVLPRIRARGIPAALVAQDGLEKMDVPWAEFDVLFVGGSTEWKTCGAARMIVSEAKRRSKLVHMGRVNSARRFWMCQRWEVDTADGTFLAFGPEENLQRLRSWFIFETVIPTPRMPG